MFLHRQARPGGHPLVRGLNTITAIQLNIQYLMPAEINALSNVISRRNIFNYITLDRHWLRPPVLVNPYIYTRLSTDLNQQSMQHSIVWFNPYVDQGNTEGPRVVHLMV